LTGDYFVTYRVTPLRGSTGAWGLAVFRAAADAEARELVAADPAVSTGMATCDVGAMLAAVLGR